MHKFDREELGLNRNPPIDRHFRTLRIPPPFSPDGENFRNTVRRVCPFLSQIAVNQLHLLLWRITEVIK